MASPLNTEFFDIIGSRLKNIRKGNGYFYDVKTIKRAQLKPFKGYDLPAVNYWPNNVINETTVYYLDSREVSLSIEAHILTRDTPFTDLCDQLATDIVIALNRATTAPKVTDIESPDLGGILEALQFDGYDYQIGEGQTPFCGIVGHFTIKYKTEVHSMLGD